LGRTVTFLPRGLAENASRLGLVVADLDPPLQREVSLVTQPGPLSPAAKIFAELARGAARPAQGQAPT